MMKPCCADFERLWGSDRQEAGFHIWRRAFEPPHYDPPRYFVLSYRGLTEPGEWLQIRVCPFCGRDLNALWDEQFSKLPTAQ